MNMFKSTFSDDVDAKSSIPKFCIAFSICVEEIFPHPVTSNMPNIATKSFSSNIEGTGFCRACFNTFGFIVKYPAQTLVNADRKSVV